MLGRQKEIKKKKAKESQDWKKRERRSINSGNKRLDNENNKFDKEYARFNKKVNELIKNEECKLTGFGVKYPGTGSCITSENIRHDLAKRMGIMRDVSDLKPKSKKETGKS